MNHDTDEHLSQKNIELENVNFPIYVMSTTFFTTFLLNTEGLEKVLCEIISLLGQIKPGRQETLLSVMRDSRELAVYLLLHAFLHLWLNK